MISGGQATKATLFYNNARRKVGLVGYWDTVAFDEVGGIKIRDPDTIQIMKDFMANGRFSRGVEVIADASLSFVGNIDLSVQQVVNSTEYDLFQPLPVELDLAVMDRFAAYIPGWEMPKNSSEFLTDRYGFITDYLAEAFHYQFSHTNRYEEVSKRIRLGQAIEGRDEKGIKKTVCAFLKILHPDGPPSDDGIRGICRLCGRMPPACEGANEQAQARRRVCAHRAVLRQRQRRGSGGRLPGVEGCTGDPAAGAAALERTKGRAKRRRGSAKAAGQADGNSSARTNSARRCGRSHRDTVPEAPAPIAPDVATAVEPREQHFNILYDDTGYTYESIMGPYLQGATTVIIEDPYIRLQHQIHNFVRFCETLLKSGTIKHITLTTSYDDNAQLKDFAEKLDDLKQSLLELDVVLEVQLYLNLHDREIRLDNGWIIKIGRGLDFYQKPGSWYEVGANDFSLRKCLETKVDIFRA